MPYYMADNFDISNDTPRPIVPLPFWRGVLQTIHTHLHPGNQGYTKGPHATFYLAQHE